jgi:epimerase transport system membrane fusion protein
VQATRARIAVLSEQLQSLNQLLENGLVTRTRVFAIENDKAELEAVLAGYQTDLVTARNKVMDSALSELKDTQAKLNGLRQQLTAAEDVAERAEIRAPADGSVVGLTVHTVGGVISPGQVLMNIVPDGDQLIVAANVDPRDRDQIQEGQSASVWLSAFSRKNQKPLQGKVRTISADRVPDPATGSLSYIARVEITHANRRPEVSLQPGMTANVMIKTGPRSTFDYLVGPLTQAMTLATR